jgi:hypothetical protein
MIWDLLEKREIGLLVASGGFGGGIMWYLVMARHCPV